MRRTPASGARVGVAMVLLFGLAAHPAVAVELGDEVVLRLRDGRYARGTLVTVPTADRLELLSQSDGIELRSSFAAERVLGILDAREFDRGNGAIVVEVGAQPSRELDAVEPVPVVRSLSIAASVANWDSDPETDGLLVHVVPLDETGQVVAVDGNLDFELFLQQFRTKRQLPWRRRDLALFTSDRWSVRVRRNDFGRHGTYVKLPFRRLHPEIDLDVAPIALLRGRLGVRGRGVFEAADADVRLRPFNRFRDELEQLTGQRYLPQERAGRWPSSPSSRLRTYP